MIALFVWLKILQSCKIKCWMTVHWRLGDWDWETETFQWHLVYGLMVELLLLYLYLYLSPLPIVLQGGTPVPFSTPVFTVVATNHLSTNGICFCWEILLDNNWLLASWDDVRQVVAKLCHTDPATDIYLEEIRHVKSEACVKPTPAKAQGYQQSSVPFSKRCAMA